MNRFDPSGRLDEALLESLTEVLAHFEGRAEVTVIGALARDLVAHMRTDTAPTRATTDLDLAVRVNSIEDFRELTKDLESLGEHRFRIGSTHVDLVPFGQIERDRIVYFHDTKLDVAGFSEAADAAETIALVDGTSVRVASLPAQCVLKILAWRDRESTTAKDALDLRTLLDAAGKPPYLDALYDEANDAMAATGNVIQDAAAFHVGRAAQAIVDHDTAAQCRRVLCERATDLASDMGGLLSEGVLAAFAAGFTSLSSN